jgi:hypothetical protein
MLSSIFSLEVSLGMGSAGQLEVEGGLNGVGRRSLGYEICG